MRRARSRASTAVSSSAARRSRAARSGRSRRAITRRTPRPSSRRLAEKLGLAPEPSEDPLPDDERATLRTRIERLQRRREQLGPVNPLAQEEYKEALEHVEELERQREDLETALRELAGPDPRHRPAHQGGLRGDLQRCRRELRGGRRPPLPRRPRQACGSSARTPARAPSSAAPSTRDGRAEEALEAADEAEEESPEDKLGVEIEITPAGKSTKRLTLLSGGEKSLTALAFLFAVFLARPCPFYILDEVEAALDDLNIDRFLKVLRSFSEPRAVHRRHAPEAHDGSRRLALRCLDGRQRRLQGDLPPAARARWRRPRDRGRRGSIGVSDSMAVVGSAAVASGSASAARSASSARRASSAPPRVAGASAVVGSAGVAGSAGVIGSAGVALSLGVVGSAGILAGLGNVGCAGCVACIGCVGCSGCVGCIGCVGLKGAVGKIGVTA